MALGTCTFGGVVIGDGVLRHSVVVSPSESPDVQTGVNRQTALVTDNSPNLTYMLRVRARLTAGSCIELERRVLAIADLKLVGKQTVVITETIGTDTSTITMEEAVLVGEIASPDTSRETNPTVDNEMVLQFLSEKRPT